MKRNTKPSWLLSLSIILVVLITAGCGSSGNNGTDTGGSTDSGSQDTLSGNFEIQYFVGGYGDQWWKEIIAEFQKLHPNLKIKQSAGPKINDQMKPRWIQGDPPDFVYIDGAGSNERQMIEDGQLMDITDWIKDAQNVDNQPITSQLLAQPTQYDSRVYTVPLVFGSWGTFYDKALFQKNGWEVPKDFDSFMQLSEKIKQSGTTPYIYTGVYPYYLYGGLLWPAVVSNNHDDGSIMNDIASLKPGVFQSEPVKKALNQIVEMRDKGYLYEGAAALNHTDSQLLWLQHKAAFIPNGLWLQNEMKDDIPDGFDFGFIPSVTQAAGGKYIANPYTNTVAIAKKAKNPEAAKAFLQFIFTKQGAVDWAEKTGALMNYKTDLDSTNASDLVKSAMQFYNSDNTIVAPVTVLDPDVDKVISDSLVALTTGKIDADEWMKRVEAAADKARSK